MEAPRELGIAIDGGGGFEAFRLLADEVALVEVFDVALDFGGGGARLRLPSSVVSRPSAVSWVRTVPPAARWGRELTSGASSSSIGSRWTVRRRRASGCLLCAEG